MNSTQRKERMKDYLSSVAYSSRQLNRMSVRSDVNDLARAGKVLSDYRVKAGRSLILLHILRNDLKNQNLKRARLVNEHVDMMLTNVIASHCYFVRKKAGHMSRIALRNSLNEEERIPTMDEVIKHRKRLLRDTAAGIDSNLKFGNSSNDDFRSSRRIFFVFIVGIGLIFIGLLSCWIWNLAK